MTRVRNNERGREAGTEPSTLQDPGEMSPFKERGKLLFLSYLSKLNLLPGCMLNSN